MSLVAYCNWWMSVNSPSVRWTCDVLPPTSSAHQVNSRCTPPPHTGLGGGGHRLFPHEGIDVFELVCVASIFPDDWSRSRPPRGPAARAEKAFRFRLPPGFQPEKVSQALKSLVPDVERWLVDQRVDLVVDTVVTVYSLEPVDVPVMDDCQP